MKCQRCLSNEATRTAGGMYLCESCAFYEDNMQCWKCQMYLPKYEFVMYKGQWYCPNCLGDIRREESREREKTDEKKDEKSKSISIFPGIKTPEKTEYCARCGALLYTVHIYRGEKYCDHCIEKVTEGRVDAPRYQPIRYRIKTKPIHIKAKEVIFVIIDKIKKAVKK